jgi:predicted nucleic acid-binding Zn ribbon protein
LPVVDGTGLARSFDEPLRAYETMRQVFTGSSRRKKSKRVIEDEAFTPGRDPLHMGDAFRELTGSLGWDPALAEARLFVEWPTIVGEGIADHARPLGVDDGKLTIQASSSAWATQLRLMRHELLVVLAEKVPEVSIDSIHVLAPGAPSWKNGPRSVPGRGPRDTYG